MCFCPICDSQAEGETIACDQCDKWFHYRCIGLHEKEIEKINDSIPYVGAACSDNIIYGSPPNIAITRFEKINDQDTVLQEKENGKIELMSTASGSVRESEKLNLSMQHSEQEKKDLNECINSQNRTITQVVDQSNEAASDIVIQPMSMSDLP